MRPVQYIRIHQIRPFRMIFHIKLINDYHGFRNFIHVSSQEILSESDFNCYIKICIILFHFPFAKNVKESPKRADAFKSKLENAGGKLIETYYTFGKYDGVSIVEAPNDEALMSCLLSVESQGNARSVTLKAFSYDEATKIIQNIQQ